MTGNEAEGGSRLLKTVEAMAIAPADARALVERHRARERARGTRPDRLADAVADSIINRYARLSAGVGGFSGLGGLVPGVGAIVAGVGGALADAAASMKLQVDMCMCLAATYGYDVTHEDARHLAFLLAAGGTLEKAGEAAAVRIGSKAGVRLLRMYLRAGALQAVKTFFRKLGVVFTRKALEKAIPFGVSVALGAAGNYALTRYVGRQAQEWFRIDAENDGSPA